MPSSTIRRLELWVLTIPLERLIADEKETFSVGFLRVTAPGEV
jgi:hypothetical protein